MPSSSTPHLLLLTAAWLAYFALHSLLASLWLKRRVADRHPAWMRGYRLGFNVIATLLLLPPLWLTFADHGPWLWRWTGAWAWLANGLALLALAGVAWSLRWYDGAEFLGLRQWRERRHGVDDQEGFHLSPLHRHVRHPWYALSLVLIWTRDMSASLLVTALLLTGYFVIGSRLEERKLIAYHGDVYRRYRRLVPALIPWPGRALTAERAAALTAASEHAAQRGSQEASGASH